MTGLTDSRDRTLTMLRAIGFEPNDWQLRVVEEYVRWADQQVSEAHIDEPADQARRARPEEDDVTICEGE